MQHQEPATAIAEEKPQIPTPSAWISTLTNIAGLSGLFTAVFYVFGYMYLAALIEDYGLNFDYFDFSVAHVLMYAYLFTIKGLNEAWYLNAAIVIVTALVLFAEISLFTYLFTKMRQYTLKNEAAESDTENSSAITDEKLHKFKKEMKVLGRQVGLIALVAIVAPFTLGVAFKLIAYLAVNEGKESAALSLAYYNQCAAEDERKTTIYEADGKTLVARGFLVANTPDIAAIYADGKARIYRISDKIIEGPRLPKISFADCTHP
ncbi:hypothetical protein QCD60_23895 [Pokkaliibacter sp. MBI-7]|uniref:hypothetical protein n=1 Tax=Pokkaliibacter sp. MBI-7 TaxID=3040600 RepID=UPI00244C5A1B|nr:hypothetical protein [Pokkaliibacter sp. MBI-7]MDH2435571.1 hypothetical protein [Pokkaliibacter sp. MBI-7]